MIRKLLLTSNDKFSTANKNVKMSSFKSSGNIQMIEGGPNRSVSNNQVSLVTLNELTMKASERIL